MVGAARAGSEETEADRAGRRDELTPTDGADARTVRAHPAAILLNAAVPAASIARRDTLTVGYLRTPRRSTIERTTAPLPTKFSHDAPNSSGGRVKCGRTSRPLASNANAGLLNAR
jgi:hypothetical protein